MAPAKTLYAWTASGVHPPYVNLRIEGDEVRLTIRGLGVGMIEGRPAAQPMAEIVLPVEVMHALGEAILDHWWAPRA